MGKEWASIRFLTLSDAKNQLEAQDVVSYTQVSVPGIQNSAEVIRKASQRI